MRQFESQRLGLIEYREEDVLTFPHGLIGFASLTQFVLVSDPRLSPFLWLQSLDDPGVCFLVVNPFLIFPDYEIDTELDPALRSEIGAVEELEVLAIVTVAEEFSDSTVNLLGPLIINRRKRMGFQIALTDSSYTTRHPLFSQAKPEGSRQAV